GQKVSITAQLTDARSGVLAWEESYERNLADIFAIQSDIVQRIISQLQATISPKEKAAIDERPTKDLIAYGLYVRAKALIATISLNAQIRLPYHSDIFELTGYIDRRQGLWNESARSLQRALALDPRNFFILQQIALSYQEFRQFRAMAAALDRALVLIPGDLDTRVTR